jgi:CheY-like chemotaxis protein
LVLENLQCVLQASSRAKTLIRQILAFSRPHRAELKPVALASVVMEAIRLVRATMPATIEIVSEVGASGVTVLAEPTQLHQILINLATNAAHAMKEGGLLRIQLERVEIDAELVWMLPELKIGPYARLSVSDTGHGMTNATLERIFEPFFTTKPPGEGTGLGLAVVHGIVRSCCGAITAESRLGEGSRFTVYLPALSQSESIRKASDVLVPRGRNERVLLVEDELPLARVGSRMLESLGYSVVAFTDPMEALSTFLQHPGDFDLVVTDLTMPGLDGLKLTEEILRSRPGTPIVLTTGFEGSLTASRAQALGVRELLQKPNSLESLGLALRRALEASATRND